MNLRLILKKYKIKYSRPSIKHLKLLKSAGLLNKCQQLISMIKLNPFINPPPYEKLVGYEKVYSRRINIKHRLVYKLGEDTIYILSLWTHYECMCGD